MAEHLDSSVSFGKQSAYNELIDIWDECQIPGWDGYDAHPVEKDTFDQAWAVVESLPITYPLPSFNAEPDGHITLEWYRHPRWILSVSVSPEGWLYYAGLFGESSPQGSEYFWGDVPKTILNLIERVNTKII